MAKQKTISGAMYRASNLEHNLRTHIPSNSVEERRLRNCVYTDDEEISLQQVYEKLFAEGIIWYIMVMKILHTFI